MYEFLIPISLFFSVAAVLILRGPLGRAIAERIAGRAPTAPPHLDDHVAVELEELRRRLGDLEERMDFSERLLTRNREAERLGSGGATRG